MYGSSRVACLGFKYAERGPYQARPHHPGRPCCPGKPGRPVTPSHSDMVCETLRPQVCTQAAFPNGPQLCPTGAQPGPTWNAARVKPRGLFSHPVGDTLSFSVSYIVPSCSIRRCSNTFVECSVCDLLPGRGIHVPRQPLPW